MSKWYIRNITTIVIMTIENFNYERGY
jgi:hypothetical protein